MDVPRIPHFYRNQKILITGGTGFIGKAIIEKLLRSCPELDIIYVVIRSKRNKDPKQRLEEFKKNIIFKRIYSERPRVIDKIVALEGDMMQPKLGLSPEDYSLLQKEVTLIFHVAATVKFNDPLPDAILLNTRGTLETVNLALGMKQLKALVHVSTTFCNPLQTTTEECIYPPPADWREAIRIAERLDKTHLTILQQKYLTGYPNTYVFTKNLAESIIWEYRNRLPISVFRLSCVVYASMDPFPGYIDSVVQGPTGITVARGKGLSTFFNLPKSGECVMDYVPIDAVAKTLVAGPWYRDTRSKTTSDDKFIINVSSPQTAISSYQLMVFGVIFTFRWPLKGAPLFQKYFFFIESKILFKICIVLFHFLPPAIFDFQRKLLKRKPINVLRIAIIIRNAVHALHHFLSRRWVFPNDNLNLMIKNVPEEDKDDFEFKISDEHFYLNLEAGLMYGGTQLSFKFGEEYKTENELKSWIEKVLMALALYITIPKTYQLLLMSLSNICA